MRVINAIVFNGNPYNTLLYAHPSPRYVMIPGSIEDALDALESEPRQILHLHWEEGFLRNSRSAAEAEAAAASVLDGLGRFVERGGRLVWTIHNELPHEREYPDAFLKLRAGIAPLAARIIVHSPAAIPVLLAQCAVDRGRIVHIPHPSYLGFYEPEAETLARPPDWNSDWLLFLGRLRDYKGLDLLVEAARLAPEIPVDVIGQPLARGPLLDGLLREAEALPSLRIAPHRVEDAALPGLLRSARGVVLPYRRFLTSGVATLAASFGRPIIAPDVEQMRDYLPPSLHDLLFRPGDATSLAASMRRLAAMDRRRLEAIRADLLARARTDSARSVSGRLFDLFDGL